MGDLVVESTGLTKSYGATRAVRGIELAIGRGAVHGLLGPNGSGKSTTVRMLLGLVRPDAGEVRLFGEPLQHNPPALLRRVGALVESPSFIPYLSGWDNLRLLEIYRGTPSSGAVDDVLRRLGLEGAAHRAFKGYSLGMKQRLGIAAALLGDPELVILDEPTNGLDPAGTREVRDLIPALAAEGRTVLLCSHLLHEVEQVCNTVSIFHRGQVVRSGRTDELVSRSARLEVQVEDMGRAEAVLRDSAWASRVSRENGALLIDDAGDRGAEISRLLAAHDLYPSILRPIRHNLEEVFLEVTEGQSDA